MHAQWRILMERLLCATGQDPDPLRWVRESREQVKEAQVVPRRQRKPQGPPADVDSLSAELEAEGEAQEEDAELSDMASDGEESGETPGALRKGCLEKSIAFIKWRWHVEVISLR